MIKVVDNIYIANPWPAIYLKDIDALVFADLHLGIEGVLANEGIYLPKRVSRLTLNIVMDTIENVNSENVFFIGDVKHSFGLLKTEEWMELKKLFRYLIEKNLSVKVVRGNHDNYLGVLLSKFNVPFYENELNISHYSLIHGHLQHTISSLNKYIIMGHEHPCIGLRDEVGILHKFKAFLVGKIKKRFLIILPAVCHLSTGSLINAISKEELLSPILKNVDLNSFIPYLIIPGEYVQRFPPISSLISTQF